MSHLRHEAHGKGDCDRLGLLPYVLFLPWAHEAHGKAFAVGPKKGTRQTWLCRPVFAMSSLPCATHVKAWLCRVF